MARGMLTEAVKAESNKLLGYEITTRELRLMPYIDYILKNNQRLEIVSADEKEILHQWKNLEFITWHNLNIEVTKKFYDAMQEILWIAYVDYEKGE